jgi:hypothetical protein
MIKNLDRKSKVRALSAIQDLLEDTSENSILSIISQGSGQLVAEIIHEALNNALSEILGEEKDFAVLNKIGDRLQALEESKVLSLLESLNQKMGNNIAVATAASIPVVPAAAPTTVLGTAPSNANLTELEKSELIARRFHSRGRDNPIL